MKISSIVLSGLVFSQAYLAKGNAAIAGYEEIWEPVSYCHSSAEGLGNLYGNTQYLFDVNYAGYTRAGPFEFDKINNQEECWSNLWTSCIKRHPITGRCTIKRKGQIIFYEKLELVGYREIDNPKVFTIENNCSVERVDSHPQSEPELVVCYDELITAP